MNHQIDHTPSVTARAHRFALDAMIEKTTAGVLSQLMKALSSTNIDAIGLSIGEDENIRYLLASRGAMSATARERVRETLDALSRDDDNDLLLPMIQTPCVLDNSEVRRIDETFENWYRQFSVGTTRITLVTFHENQYVVDAETRALLLQLSRVVEATLVMLEHKERARTALVDGPQILLEVNIEGIASIREDFGDFEAEEMMLGLIDNLRASLDAVTHVGQKDGHILSIMLPETEQALLSRLRLEIAETIRLYPTPDGYSIDSQIRENVLGTSSVQSTPIHHRLHLPTAPSSVTLGIRSVAN